MNTLPVSGSLSGALETQSDLKTDLEKLRDCTAQLLGGTEESTLTLASGFVTITGSLHTVTCASAQSLTYIDATGIPDGTVLLLRADASSSTITVQHDTGSSASRVLTLDGKSFTLNTIAGYTCLVKTGVYWREAIRGILPPFDSDGFSTLNGLSSTQPSIVPGSGVIQVQTDSPSHRINLLESHSVLKTNPHAVTASQVGSTLPAFNASKLLSIGVDNAQPVSNGGLLYDPSVKTWVPSSLPTSPVNKPPKHAVLFRVDTVDGSTSTCTILSQTGGITVTATIDGVFNGAYTYYKIVWPTSYKTNRYFTTISVERVFDALSPSDSGATIYNPYYSLASLRTVSWLGVNFDVWPLPLALSYTYKSAILCVMAWPE